MSFIPKLCSGPNFFDMTETSQPKPAGQLDAKFFQEINKQEQENRSFIQTAQASEIKKIDSGMSRSAYINKRRERVSKNPIDECDDPFKPINSRYDAEFKHQQLVEEVYGKTTRQSLRTGMLSTPAFKASIIQQPTAPAPAVASTLTTAPTSVIPPAMPSKKPDVQKVQEDQIMWDDISDPVDNVIVAIVPDKHTSSTAPPPQEPNVIVRIVSDDKHTFSATAAPPQEPNVIVRIVPDKHTSSTAAPPGPHETISSDIRNGGREPPPFQRRKDFASQVEVPSQPIPEIGHTPIVHLPNNQPSNLENDELEVRDHLNSLEMLARQQIVAIKSLENDELKMRGCLNSLKMLAKQQIVAIKSLENDELKMRGRLNSLEMLARQALGNIQPSPPQPREIVLTPIQRVFTITTALLGVLSEYYRLSIHLALHEIT